MVCPVGSEMVGGVPARGAWNRFHRAKPLESPRGPFVVSYPITPSTETIENSARGWSSY